MASKRTVLYKVTHNQRPPQRRTIGPFYEWGPANDWTQYMEEADVQVFMSTAMWRELTFTALDEQGEPYPPGYPILADTPIPDGAVVVLVPSLAGPIRTIVYPRELPRPTHTT